MKLNDGTQSILAALGALLSLIGAIGSLTLIWDGDSQPNHPLVFLICFLMGIMLLLMAANKQFN